MPVSISYIPEHHLVELLYSGIIPNSDLVSAATEALELAVKHKTARFLADTIAMVGGHSITNLYSLLGLYDVLNVPRPFYEAIILPNMVELRANAEFYEVAANNRGYTVRLFADRESALEWLGKLE